MPKIADYIVQFQEQIVQRYVQEIGHLASAQGLTYFETIDTLYEYLETLAGISRAGKRERPEQTARRLEETHIGIRLRTGFQLEEVIGEYRLMGRLITELWQHRPDDEQPAAEDIQLLTDELQSAMDRAMDVFTGYSADEWQTEKHYLRRLDALSTELMAELSNHEALLKGLQPLLEILQEAMVAKGSALFLVDEEGQQLLPSAVAGQASEPDQAVMLIQPSYLAQIAATSEPVYLPDAYNAEGLVSDTLRRSGLRSLLGLRLYPQGKLMGVLYIGIPHVGLFDPQSKRYFEMLVDHLAGIIERARLSLEAQQAQQRFQWLLELSPDGVIISASDGIVYANHAAMELLGAEEKQQVLGHSSFEFIQPEHHELAREHFSRTFEASKPSLAEICFRRLDGTVIDIEVSAGSINWEGHPATQVLMRDIRRRKAAERALTQERERLQITLACIADGVITTDIEGRASYLNPAAEQLTGWSSADAIGRPLDDVLSLLDADRRRSFGNVSLSVIEQRQPTSLPMNTQLQRRNGELLAIEESAAPLWDGAGHLLGAVIAFRDISETRALAAKLSHLATHDSLTDLPNRTLLLDRAALALANAERYGGHVAVLYLDLDRFKQINDTLGHPTGDQLLMQVAERLRNCTRRTDTVSRQGGDEFIVLLSEVSDPAYLTALAKQIVQRIGAPYHINSRNIYTSSSIGISVFPADGRDPETLIKHADMAMYHAKERGRNNFQFFTQQMNQHASERRLLENDLRVAIEKGQLELHFQPQIALDSGRSIGAETLLRWRHPTLGLILPHRFIPVAEDTGLIIEIGEWVLHNACRQTQAWFNAELPIGRVSVNVSALQFHNEHFCDQVDHILNTTGLPPNLLELELTESVIMTDLARSASHLNELKQLGVYLAIDDFGTGYSSLSYLKQLPVDTLKIDRSFVQDISTDADDAAIVQAIIRMGHSLKLAIVAEGVESQEAVNFLTFNACDRAQGNYFSRPLEASDYERQLNQLF